MPWLIKHNGRERMRYTNGLGNFLVWGNLSRCFSTLLIILLQLGKLRAMSRPLENMGKKSILPPTMKSGLHNPTTYKTVYITP